MFLRKGGESFEFGYSSTRRKKFLRILETFLFERFIKILDEKTSSLSALGIASLEDASRLMGVVARKVGGLLYGSHECSY